MNDDLLKRAAKIGLPPKSEPIMIDVAEFIALKAIATRMLAEMAVAQEISGGLQAQTWINEFAESCADMISQADLIAPHGRDLGNIRQRALDCLNTILGGIKFPKTTKN
jgi:hypothetical protein